jgi:hypothetical protein
MRGFRCSPVIITKTKYKMRRHKRMLYPVFDEFIESALPAKIL